AYCEVQLTGNQPGDVEHYRPKNDLVDENGRSIQHPKTGEEHPGYYWLAYDRQNLLPSCIECNRPSTSRTGQRLGKRTQFPIAGTRAFGPLDDIAKEMPLLLNPLSDDPEQHLIYDETTGIVSGTTPEGRETVRLLALNRDGLLSARKQVASEIKGLMLRLS